MTKTRSNRRWPARSKDTKTHAPTQSPSSGYLGIDRVTEWAGPALCQSPTNGICSANVQNLRVSRRSAAPSDFELEIWCSAANGRAVLVLRGILVEHPQGAQGVPPARPAIALVHLERHLAGVLGLERPPAVGVALGRDQVDCLGDRSSGATPALRRYSRPRSTS